MRDLASNLGVAATLAPAVFAATTKGSAVDLREFDSAVVVINTGEIAGAGLYDVKLQESATTTDGDFTDVAAEHLIGSLPGALAASSVYKQSYVGTKRYVRAVITKQSGTSIAAGAVIVRGHAHRSPVA
jgi:hypothetical protein